MALSDRGYCSATANNATGQGEPHATTTLIDPSGDEVAIDAGIAPLISALWAHDVLTLNCCQENEPGIIWIEFMSPEDAEAFLQLAVPSRKGGRHSLYGRAYQYGWGNDWRYDVHLSDLAERMNPATDEVEYGGPPDYHFSLSVRFPAADYPKILAHVRRA